MVLGSVCQFGESSIRISVSDARTLAAEIERSAYEAEDHGDTNSVVIRDLKVNNGKPLFKIDISPHDSHKEWLHKRKYDNIEE